MTMICLALGALAFSTVAIFALCIGDPKRRRAVGDNQAGMASGLRRLLVMIACIPGLVCMFFGDAAAFLIWLGGCALVGWALAAALSGSRPRPSRNFIMPRLFQQNMSRLGMIGDE